jgi:hypothetical protein
MNESQYIRVYMKSFANTVDKLWWYKIPDARGTGKKPFDVFGYYIKDDKKVSFAWEFKFHKKLDVWSLAKVTDHQLASLKQLAKFGVEACVVLGIRFTLFIEDQEKLEIKKRRVAKDLVWPIDLFLEYKKSNPTINVRDLVKEQNG